MSAPQAVHAYTSATRSVWLTSDHTAMNLGELRRAVAAAEELPDDADVSVETNGTTRPFKRIDIQERISFGPGIVDVVDRASI